MQKEYKTKNVLRWLKGYIQTYCFTLFNYMNEKWVRITGEMYAVTTIHSQSWIVLDSERRDEESCSSNKGFTALKKIDFFTRLEYLESTDYQKTTKIDNASFPDTSTEEEQ